MSQHFKEICLFSWNDEILESNNSDQSSLSSSCGILIYDINHDKNEKNMLTYNTKDHIIELIEFNILNPNNKMSIKIDFHSTIIAKPVLIDKTDEIILLATTIDNHVHRVIFDKMLINTNTSIFNDNNSNNTNISTKNFILAQPHKSMISKKLNLPDNLYPLEMITLSSRVIVVHCGTNECYLIDTDNTNDLESQINVSISSRSIISKWMPSFLKSKEQLNEENENIITFQSYQNYIACICIDGTLRITSTDKLLCSKYLFSHGINLLNNAFIDVENDQIIILTIDQDTNQCLLFLLDIIPQEDLLTYNIKLKLNMPTDNMHESIKDIKLHGDNIWLFCNNNEIYNWNINSSSINWNKITNSNELEHKYYEIGDSYITSISHNFLSEADLILYMNTYPPADHYFHRIFMMDRFHQSIIRQALLDLQDTIKYVDDDSIIIDQKLEDEVVSTIDYHIRLENNEQDLNDNKSRLATQLLTCECWKQFLDHCKTLQLQYNQCYPNLFLIKNINASNNDICILSKSTLSLIIQNQKINQNDIDIYNLAKSINELLLDKDVKAFLSGIHSFSGDISQHYINFIQKFSISNKLCQIIPNIRHYFNSLQDKRNTLLDYITFISPSYHDNNPDNINEINNHSQSLPEEIMIMKALSATQRHLVLSNYWQAKAYLFFLHFITISLNLDINGIIENEIIPKCISLIQSYSILDWISHIHIYNDHQNINNNNINELQILNLTNELNDNNTSMIKTKDNITSYHDASFLSCLIYNFCINHQLINNNQNIITLNRLYQLTNKFLLSYIYIPDNTVI